MARNLRKHEFWTESSGLGTFFARKEETVLEAKTRCKAPITTKVLATACNQTELVAG